MKIYVTADTHFGHRMLVDKGYRPIDYEYKIMDSFKVINQADMLIHLGDFCLGQELAHHDMLTENLLCKKILVKGNHDGKSYNWYMTHGWDFVCNTFRWNYFGKKILFSHIPQQWDGKYDINIHGHFHDSDHRSKEPQFNEVLTDKHELLSIEQDNYKLLTLEQILSRRKTSMGEDVKKL